MRKIILLVICSMLFSTIFSFTSSAIENDYVFGNTRMHIGTYLENTPFYYTMVSWYDGKSEPPIKYHVIVSKFRCEFNCSLTSITASLFIAEPSIPNGGLNAFCVLFSMGMFPLAVTESIFVDSLVAINYNFRIYNCSSELIEPINITSGWYYLCIYSDLPRNYMDYQSATPFLCITNTLTDFHCYPTGVYHEPTIIYNNLYSMEDVLPCEIVGIELSPWTEATPTIWGNCLVNLSVIGTSFDPNSTGVWLYLGAILTLDNGQFFLLILVGLWTYFIYLFYKEKEVIFSFAIICCGLPLSIILSGVSYYNSYPFGYLISFIIVLISFLIPSYAMYQKNKKKSKK